MKREMTVGYATGDKNAHASGHYAGEQKPMIRIANRFLLKSGFMVGSKIEIEYMDKIIIIAKKS